MKYSTGEEEGEAAPRGDSLCARPCRRERPIWLLRVPPPTSPKRIADTALPREQDVESLAGIARGGANA